MKTVRDGEAVAGAGEIARRDGFRVQHQVVRTSGPGEAGFKRRVEDALFAANERLEHFGGLMLDETFRADARPARKESLEVRFGEAHLPRHLGQRGLRLAVRVEKADGALDARIV